MRSVRRLIGTVMQDGMLFGGSIFENITISAPTLTLDDAWEAGVDQSGVTIHWVDNGVDTGKVIKQVRVPRLADDTIESFEARIHENEYKLYPEVLESLGVEKK